MKHLIIDGHLDAALNALGDERDQMLPVSAIRKRESHIPKDELGTCTITFAEMKQCGIPLCLTTVLARAKPWIKPGRKNQCADSDWPTQDMAYAFAMGQLAYYRELERRGDVTIITDRSSLDAHWERWETNDPDAPVGLILTMEGADPITDPDRVQHWHDLGLRSIFLAHYGHSHYAAGTPAIDRPQSHEQDGPVTAKGFDLLKEMSKLDMPLDMTHLSDTSFWNAAKVYDGPVYSSHTNCRVLADDPRQFTDKQIKFITDRHGVLGLSMHFAMIKGGFTGDACRVDPMTVTMDHLVDHIDHICQLAGNAKHICIGSDLDGGFGSERCPVGLDSCDDMHKFGPIMASRGYSDTDIAGFYHGNWLRFLRRVLPA
jgi:membrane dipeptidase